MSLHGTFNVGYREIGNYEIVRRSNTDEAVLDDNTISVYEYRVTHYLQDAGDGHPGVEVKRGKVEHRFGDGAVELLAKVFIMASPAV